MKPSNETKFCGFMASAASEKLKQDKQANVSDAMQAMSSFNVTQLEVILRHYYVLWVANPFMYHLRLWSHAMQHFKMKSFGILRSSCPFKFSFSITSHFTRRLPLWIAEHKFIFHIQLKLVHNVHEAVSWSANFFFGGRFGEIMYEQESLYCSQIGSEDFLIKLIIAIPLRAVI